METSVLQNCITEARLLVDAAYNQTERRWAWAWVWGLHGPGRVDDGGWMDNSQGHLTHHLPLGTLGKCHVGRESPFYPSFCLFTPC